MLCMDVFKKMKCFRVFEPSLAILGFLIVAGCVAFSFFLLDCRAVIKGSKLLGQSERLLWLKLDEASGEKVIRKVDFLSQEGGKCNVFEGDWVWDDSYPLYQSRDCSLLDEGFRCNENGRPDLFYTKWRWQPKDCNLPRFDAKIMLEKLRNKRMVFVGDSIGRNQWESLLCMLSSVIPDKKSVYEVFGNPITKHKGFLIFKFEDYNCTVEYYRSTFLVVQGRAPAEVSSKVKTTLRLDQMDWTSWKWRDADFIVFNTGHWWNYEKTIRMGCYFQEGLEVKMEMDVNMAYERSLQTVVDWAHRELNAIKTQVFFRTYAPVHFRGGDWNTGGHCHLETLPELTTSLVPSENWDRYNTLTNVLLAHANASSQKTMELLNVTHMTSRRKDGHSSLYYLGPKSPAALNRQDCSHWCLPGVPDTWNELLYSLILKQENMQRGNLTDIHPA